MTAKLKIGITRPQHQAVALCQAIENIDAIPVSFPTLEIVPPEDLSAFITAIHHLDKFEMAIFTSANSLLYAPSFPVVDTQMIAIGPATALALHAKGVSEVTTAPPPFTSEALLQLTNLQKVQGKNIALVTGEGGRMLLWERLRERGARVTPIVAYQRRRPIHPEGLEKIANVDIIVITSQESLANLMALIGQYRTVLLTKKLLVIGEKLAQLGKAAGFNHIILAKNATNQAIINALQDYRNGKHSR